MALNLDYIVRYIKIWFCLFFRAVRQGRFFFAYPSVRPKADISPERKKPPIRKAFHIYDLK